MRKLTVSIPVPDIHPVNNRVTRKVVSVPLNVGRHTKARVSHVRGEISTAHAFRKENRDMRKAAKAEATKSFELVSLETAFAVFQTIEISDESQYAWEVNNSFQACLVAYVQSLVATNDAKKLKVGHKLIQNMMDEHNARMTPEQQSQMQTMKRSMSIFSGFAPAT